MPKKSFSDGFKAAYALSLVGQLGFYITIPFLVAILIHNYADKFFLDQYLIPDHQTIHFFIDFGFAFLTGVYSIWQIYRLLLPFMDHK